MRDEKKRVVIYTTRYCSFCDAAKKLLKSKNVAFLEVDVTEDDKMREELVRMTGGRVTVPQVFADGVSLGGYDDLVQFFSSGGTLE